MRTTKENLEEASEGGDRDYFEEDALNGGKWRGVRAMAEGMG